MTDAALEGVTVLDLSDGVSGGYCTKVLRDLGARVVKIEAPGVGDSTRSVGPFLDGVPSIETSASFLYLNAGKESVALDIASAEGRDAMLKLARSADVVVESAKPGRMADLGLGYNRLEQVNPALVMASIAYFGQNGPYSDYEGSELVAYAVSGYMYLTGDEDREPMKAGGAQAEYQAGLAAAMAVLAALTYRDFTGEGQHIDLSTVEAASSTLDGVAFYTAFEHRGETPKRAGTRLITREPRAPYPSALLPCKDGWVHVHYSPSNPEGLAWLTANPRLEEPEVMGAMRGHADEIDELLVDWLKDHDREEVQTLAQEIRVPFTMVQSVPEVLEDPQNTARGFFIETEHPEAGTLQYPTSPFRQPEIPWSPGRAPLLGEHTRQVLVGELGLSDDEVRGLTKSGAIQAR
ncbi:MAG: CoA transferase [SAR202 cluster bacterium]|jgi:crotonobetainyl-CoA:carnitine CoA-transferase CaiB-like acyl-CoA transferase|nr:CoA transferase [SAR202 cluster bacterium]MDP6801409.1 CoA transferase [SAR202 cluster bacterium]MQG69329.1 CoA transferase [SAR202 cluster bacterium]|tara:strand:+ start:1719 stop:2939 length:1221 start_codon:yes stop_codon:yes gene_type:complete